MTTNEENQGDSNNWNPVDENQIDMQPNDQYDDALINSGSLKPARLSFKEQWEQVDELCPTCGKVSVPATGLTRQNIKKLFSFQTDAQSLTILFLFLMCCAFAFSTYSFMTATVNCSNYTALAVDNLNTPSNPLLLDPNLQIDSTEETEIVLSNTSSGGGS